MSLVDLANERVILILGYPRSGTTWLAKIFDSHPDILYRHEPDELSPPRADAEPAGQISYWLKQRSLRAAGKRPTFAKSWRPLPLSLAHETLTLLLAGIERLPIGPLVSCHLGLPDLIAIHRRKSVRAVIKLVNWDGSATART